MDFAHVPVVNFRIRHQVKLIKNTRSKAIFWVPLRWFLWDNWAIQRLFDSPCLIGGFLVDKQFNGVWLWYLQSMLGWLSLVLIFFAILLIFVFYCLFRVNLLKAHFTDAQQWINEFSNSVLLCMRFRPIRLFQTKFFCCNRFWTILILWKADINTRQWLCESRYVLWFWSIWFWFVAFDLRLAIKSITKSESSSDSD